MATHSEHGIDDSSMMGTIQDAKPNRNIDFSHLPDVNITGKMATVVAEKVGG